VLNAVSQEVRQYDLLPFGGHMATAMAPGMPEFDRILQDRVPAWCAVGEALSLTYRTFRFHQDQLKGGASISKSLDLLEELGVSNRKYLRNWWSEFKCVAHLCASVVVVSEIIAPALRKRYPDQVTSGFPFFAGLGATLAFGREFQKFSTSYKGHGRRTPLLTPSEVWGISKDYQLPSASLDLLGPLSSELLDRLRNRQAPKRI
jgi:hypothetical protein